MPESDSLLLTLPDGCPRLRVARWDAMTKTYRYVDNDALPAGADVSLDDERPAPGIIGIR